MVVHYDSPTGPYFFKYKDMHYMNNTMVMFSEDFMKRNGFSPESKYGKFTRGNMTNGNNIFHTYKKNKFGDYTPCCNNYKGYIVIKDWELESAIEGITKDMVYPCVIAPIPNKKGCEVEGVWKLWGIYLALMFGSMLFKDFVSAWVILTIAFVIIRHILIVNASR